MCPPEFSEVLLTPDAPQFEVIGFGDFVTADPASGAASVVNDIILGSGSSVDITGQDSVLVKLLCERAIVLSLGITVNGATAVEFVYIDGSNGVVRTRRVSNRDVMNRLNCRTFSGK